MKKNLVMWSVVAVALTCLGAIIRYTDKPNAIPVDSDFFSLQRNNDYINSSVAQVRGYLFGNPVFTGSGTMNGTWTMNGPAFLPLQPNLGGLGTDGSGKIIAGAGFGGNQFILTMNGFGTNLTLYGGGNFFGVYYFDEVDAMNFFPANFFTSLTNYPVLGTDGNGKLRRADTVSVTFSNQFAVDVTHAFVASNSTALAVASYDGAHNLTNIPSSHGVLTNTASGPASFGLLQPTEMANTGTAGTYRSVTFNAQGLETSGSNPTTFSGYGLSDTAANLFAALTTWDFGSATNLTYTYKTNLITGTVLTFGQAYRTNLAGNLTISALTINNHAFYETLILWTTNSSGSDHTVTSPSGVIGPVGSGTPSVLTSTNKTLTRYIYEHYGDSDITVSKTDFGP